EPWDNHARWNAADSGAEPSLAALQPIPRKLSWKDLKMYKTEDLGSLSSGTRRICKQVSGNRRWALIWLTGIMLISQPSCSETGPTQRPPGQEESLKT